MIQLEKINKLENVSVNFNSSVNGNDAKALFCQNWENAKLALSAIGAMVKNPAVKLVISIVISVGDGIKSKICTG
jgi:hypothetical protein